MKKVFGILFVVLLTTSFVFAQDIPFGEELDELEEGVEDFEEFVEDEDVRSDYLKQEWTKLLDKSKVGKVLLGISNFLSKFSPLFKVILGVEYSLSWAFIFAVAIWLMFFVLLLGPAESLFPNKLSSIAISFIVTSLIGISGIIKKFVDILTNVIENPTAIWISIIIAILLIFILQFFGKKIGKLIKKSKEKFEKEETEKAQKKIQVAGKLAEMGFKYKSRMRRSGKGKKKW
jgi:ABC-type multidrug transport system fused ATPase/permease subunit